MSEPTSERERIRERKRQRLLEEAAEPATPESPAEPIYLHDRDQDFDAFVDEYDVVLVDFYADWCGPCQMLNPVLESVAAETAGTILKVDVDERGDLAARHNVQGVPTLVLYADGEPVEQLVGGQEQSRLVELVERHTAN
jgi:thioredoxin 1